MNVYYMNGAGNDFMVMDARGETCLDFEKMAIELCKLENADGFMAVDLSEKADVPYTGLKEWSNSMPAADKLLRVAQILGVTVENLLEEAT